MVLSRPGTRSSGPATGSGRSGSLEGSRPSLGFAWRWRGGVWNGRDIGRPAGGVRCYRVEGTWSTWGALAAGDPSSRAVSVGLPPIRKAGVVAVVVVAGDGTAVYLPLRDGERAGRDGGRSSPSWLPSFAFSRKPPSLVFSGDPCSTVTESRGAFVAA